MAINLTAQKDGRRVWNKHYLSPDVAFRVGKRLIAEKKADYVVACGVGRLTGFSSLSQYHDWTACESLKDGLK